MILIIGESSLAKQLRWLIEKEDIKFFLEVDSAIKTQLGPRLILIDVDFLVKKDVNTLAVFKRLRERFEKAKIVLYTAFEKDKILDNFLKEANADLVLKSEDLGELMERIK